MRVTLREVRPADLATLFQHQLDPEAVRMAVFPARDWQAFSAHWSRILADPQIAARAIVADNSLAGFVNAWGHDGIREVGYWVGRAFWGRGVATAALAQFVAVERVRPLYAHVAVANRASARVLEKCGFRRHSTAPGSPGPGVPVVEEHLYILEGGPELSA